MNIQETLDYIHSVCWLGSRPGLERISALMDALDHPERKLRFVHIAGTNGKGSTAAMTASILRCAGYRTGLFTSPYLFRFHERMQVNGQEITDEALIRATAIVRPAADAMESPPTEFELVTAIALVYFVQMRCDIVVLEVGMGGALDSTNIIPAPECAVLTNIGLDHTAFLGSTAEEIAATKAGILKPGTEAVLYPQSAGVTEVIRQRCRALDIPLHIADPAQLAPGDFGTEGQAFSYKNRGPFHISLLGRHQLYNAAVALETAEVLRHRGFSLPETAIVRGLAETRWPARFEILSREPWFVLDGGHNPQCAETVAANLRQYFPGKRVIFLLGILRDKNIAEFTDILDPAAAEYITITPENPRAMPAGELAEFLTARFHKPALAAESISAGVSAALNHARATDSMVCCSGSLYLAGPVRHCFGL